jgi:hypothetical protein
MELTRVINCSSIVLNHVFDDPGPIVFEHRVSSGCEGIVSKRRGSRYVAGRADCWIEVKNPAAPAVRREAEVDWRRFSRAASFRGRSASATTAAAVLVLAQAAHASGRRQTVTKLAFAIASMLPAVAFAPAASAQVTIDVAKITCDQWLLFKVTDPRNITLWLSGYIHGKKGVTVVDQQALRDNEDKVKDYCRGHLDMPVMQAVDTLLNQGQPAR